MGGNRTMQNSKVAELSSASSSVKTNNNKYLLLHGGSMFLLLVGAWEWRQWRRLMAGSIEKLW